MKGRLKSGDVIGVRAETVEDAQKALDRDWPGCTFSVEVPGMRTKYNYIAEVLTSVWDVD